MRPAAPVRLRETRRARFRRRIHLLPHLFTIGNLFAGWFAVSAVLAGDLDRAAVAIVVGFVLDSLDGAVARLVKAPSRIGVQLDSLADIVTFGIATALLAFAWGTGGVASAGWGVHLRRIAWIASFAFLVAGTLRLARFNVMTVDQGTDRILVRKDAFVGMPIPTAALCVAIVVHLLKEPVRFPALGGLWLVYLSTLAGLMISRVPFPHFRHLLARPPRPHLLMLVLALLLPAVYYYSEVVLFSLLGAYLVAVLVSNLRRRRAAEPLNELPERGV